MQISLEQELLWPVLFWLDLNVFETKRSPARRLAGWGRKDHLEHESPWRQRRSERWHSRSHEQPRAAARWGLQEAEGGVKMWEMDFSHTAIFPSATGQGPCNVISCDSLVSNIEGCWLLLWKEFKDMALVPSKPVVAWPKVFSPTSNHTYVRWNGGALLLPFLIKNFENKWVKFLCGKQIVPKSFQMPEIENI